jgi:hypothetical protein
MERGLWSRWVLVVSLGEVTGFLAPAFVAVVGSGLPDIVRFGVLPLAGLVEGAALGLAQAAVLRGRLPDFRPRRWVVATSLGAGLAWVVGMLPPTTYAVWRDWAPGWVAIVGVLLGSVLLATIGTAQLLATPGTVRSPTWVAWTALGWCAGLSAFGLFTTPLWQEGQATWLIALIGLAGAVVMAVSMSAVTGVGAARLVARAHRPGSPEASRHKSHRQVPPTARPVAH